MKEENVVYLFHPKKGLRPFEPQHAANIMSIPEGSRGGWQQPQPPPTEEQGDENQSVDVDNPTNQGSDKRRKRGKVDDITSD